jgi:hypothetical protein
MRTEIEDITPRKLAALKRKGILKRRKAEETKRLEEQKREDSDRRYMKKEAPTVLKKFVKELKEAIVNGEKELSFEYGYSSVSNDPRLEAITEYCKKNKLTCTPRYSEGTSDMGDSAAPCVVHWSSYRVDVTWK